MGVLTLAFGAGQFFVIQKCPTPYKLFVVPSPCWLNASSMLSHWKNQTWKPSPTSPRFRCPPGRVRPPPFNTTVCCNLRTQEKVPVKTSSWLALHFFGLWIVFSPLHFEPSASMWLLFASCSGWSLLDRHGSSKGHSHGASPCVYLQERWHRKQTFSFSGLTILLQTYAVAHNLCQWHEDRAWLNHKRDGWQST